MGLEAGCCSDASVAAECPIDAASLQAGEPECGCCCKCEEAGESEPAPAPRCKGKACCIKGFTPAPEWSPDVDDVGVAMAIVASEPTAIVVQGTGHGTGPSWRGPPDQRSLDPASRSLLRTRCALIV
jgi:hypothetical protein